MDLLGSQLTAAENADLSVGIPQLRKVAQRFGSEWQKELAIGQGNPAANLQRRLPQATQISDDLAQSCKNVLEQNTAALEVLRNLSSQANAWTALDIQSRIGEMRAALTHAESCRDAVAAHLASLTARAKQAKQLKVKANRESGKDIAQRLREYEFTRLPAAWRSLVRDLKLLPSADGSFPQYKPSRGAKKVYDTVDWSAPAWWLSVDGGALQSVSQRSPPPHPPSPSPPEPYFHLALPFLFLPDSKTLASSQCPSSAAFIVFFSLCTYCTDSPPVHRSVSHSVAISLNTVPSVGNSPSV